MSNRHVERSPYELVLDMGSTSAKVKIGRRDSPGAATTQAGIPFGSSEFPLHRKSEYMHETKLSPGPGGREYKWAEGTKVLRAVSDQVFSLFMDPAAKDVDVSLAVVTGRTHSLVISHKDQQRSKDTKILLDDPSLYSEEFTLPDNSFSVDSMRTQGVNEEKIQEISHQRDILKRYIPDFSTQGLRKSLALMKILTLKNHPETISTMFGEGVKFEDLRFNSFMGYVMGMLSADERSRVESQLQSIPHPDIRSFAGGKVMSVPKVKSLLSELGVSVDGKDRQLDFIKSRYLVDKDRKAETPIDWYTIQDLPASAYVIWRLMENGTLGKDVEESKKAIAIEADTVAKILFHPLTDTAAAHGNKLTDNKQMSYELQRMGGGVNAELIKWFLPSQDETGTGSAQDIYRQVDETLLKTENDTENNPYWYFPDFGEVGLLAKEVVRNNTPQLQPIPLTHETLRDLGQDIHDQKEREQVITAIIHGMVYGIRNKTEQILRKQGINQQEAEIYVYGGLVSRSEPMRRVFGKIMQGSVFRLGIDNAGTSAAIRARDEIKREGKIFDHTTYNIQIPSWRIDEGIDRGNKYGIWDAFFTNLKSSLNIANPQAISLSGDVLY